MNSFNKTEAAVFSCRLCFLRAFPFISLLLYLLYVIRGLFCVFFRHYYYSYTLFTALPVIIIDRSRVNVPAQLHNGSSFAVMIYSTSPVNAVLQQMQSVNINASAVNKDMLTYTSNITSSRVRLEVLNNTVDAEGFEASIEFTVTSIEQFGEYYVSVNNSVGTTKHIVAIFPGGEYLV